MKRGPKHPIGETVVIFLEVAGVQIGDNIVGARDVGAMHHGLRWIVNRLAAPAHPDAAMFLEQGTQRHFQPTRMHRAARAGNRDTIGKNADARHEALTG